MKNVLKTSIFAAMLVCSTVAWAQDADADKVMEKINEALSKGDCDRADRAYTVWKEFTKTTNASVESRIRECNNGTPTPVTSNSNATVSVNGVAFEMVYVAGGTFTMGCTAEQGSDCYSDEKHTHSVTLSSYSIGKYEVTQAQWKAVMGSSNNPSHFKGDNLPVENVSWNDAKDFISKLNAKTGKNFRLPTEAEWEFAARGGNKSKGYKYSGSNSLGNVGLYYENAGDYKKNDATWNVDEAVKNKTHAVGQKTPNELGIYDMSGNVWEWCSDYWGNYSSSSQTNPAGATTGRYRVYRGGGWNDFATYCRVANRNGYTPADRFTDLGFRLVLP